MPTWPLQKDCNKFYGNPRGANGGASAAWEAANLTNVKPPFTMRYAGTPIKTIRVHKKCAESLLRVLNALWVAAGKKQSVIDEWGVSTYGGAYNFRLMRGGSNLSMHSWGCAIDLDPARNGLGDSTPRFANYPQVIKAFSDEGWEWGGSWSAGGRDGMHWQAAWTKANAVKPGVPVATPKPTPAPKPATPKPTAVKPAPAPVIAPVVAEASPYAHITIPRKIPGTKNDPVVFYVQHVLEEKGWHEVGTVDGLMGSRTQGAILMFRNEQEPTLEPLTPTIDQDLVNTLENAQERKVSITRASTTGAELAAKGDATVITTDTMIKGGIATASLAGIGGADQQGVLDSAKTKLDGFDTAQEIATRGLDAIQWTLQHWWIPVIGIAGFFIWKAWKVRQQRVDDHRTGKNLAL